MEQTAHTPVVAIIPAIFPLSLAHAEHSAINSTCLIGEEKSLNHKGFMQMLNYIRGLCLNRGMLEETTSLPEAFGNHFGGSRVVLYTAVLLSQVKMKFF